MRSEPTVAAGRLLGMIAGAVITMAATLQAQTSYDYRVLATTKTSTLEKELNEAADAGFRFSFVMGGETAIGGSEGVAVLTKIGRGGKYRVQAPGHLEDVNDAEGTPGGV